jgi:hypothetical protein
MLVNLVMALFGRRGGAFARLLVAVFPLLWTEDGRGRGGAGGRMGGLVEICRVSS